MEDNRNALKAAELLEQAIELLKDNPNFKNELIGIKYNYYAIEKKVFGNKK